MKRDRIATCASTWPDRSDGVAPGCHFAFRVPSCGRRVSQVCLIARDCVVDFAFMQIRETEIAIIGAGPAGAHLASRLAAEGRDVVLFDPKGAWEKPCGGGVPTRAIREFAFILESSNYPRKLVRQITMISPLERRVTLTLDEPFAVFSRQVLKSLVL